MLESTRFRIEPASGRSIVSLRVYIDDASDVATTLQLPTTPRMKDGNPAAFCLAPDQWLLVSNDLPAEQLIADIEAELPKCTYAAIDVSSTYNCLRISGPAARELIAMGCAVDLHSVRFTQARCARTRFAQVAVLIVLAAHDTFDVFVDAGLESHLRGWLARAAEDPLLGERRST